MAIRLSAALALLILSTSCASVPKTTPVQYQSPPSKHHGWERFCAPYKEGVLADCRAGYLIA